jgi:hypothetical protein
MGGRYRNAIVEIVVEADLARAQAFQRAAHAGLGGVGSA